MMKKKLKPYYHEKSGMPDSSLDEGCKARILTSYFLRPEAPGTEGESDPFDLGEYAEVLSV